MIRVIVAFLIIVLSTFHADAIKLNQRGEKMVSEIRVELNGNYGYAPYSIKFGYDFHDEVNSIVFERKCVEHEIAVLKKDSKGNITRTDIVNGKRFGAYEIKVDSKKRPTEMLYYEVKNAKHVKLYSFKYIYDFEDFALSIIHHDEGDTFADLRESIKIDNGNIHTFSNNINLRKGSESILKARDLNISYLDTRNDLNIDLFQIVRGYSNVGGAFLSLVVDNNFLMLSQWIPLKSPKLLLSINDYNLCYNYSDTNITSVDVKFSLTDELMYTIFIKYVE